MGVRNISILPGLIPFLCSWQIHLPASFPLTHSCAEEDGATCHIQQCNSCDLSGIISKMAFHQTNITQSLDRHELLSFLIRLLLEFISLLHHVVIPTTKEALDLRCSALPPIFITCPRFFSRDLINEGAFHWFVWKLRLALFVVKSNHLPTNRILC